MTLNSGLAQGQASDSSLGQPYQQHIPERALCQAVQVHGAQQLLRGVKRLTLCLGTKQASLQAQTRTLPQASSCVRSLCARQQPNNNKHQLSTVKGLAPLLGLDCEPYPPWTENGVPCAHTMQVAGS